MTIQAYKPPLPDHLNGHVAQDIRSGSRRGRTGTVEATVFQKMVDYPDEYPHGFHVTLDDGTLRCGGIKLG